MIVCSQCGWENPLGARYCMRCAAELSLRCAVCGTENPRDAHFCLRCGTPLAHVASTERRIISVLFADLVGSTPLTGRLDPERMRTLMGDYFSAMRQEVERYGGIVEKFIGDAVMAVFGMPAVHEDDPERAVRAAVSMQKRMAALNTQLGADLHIRIGISTGEVVADPTAVTSGQFLVTGEVVNFAARLEEGAPADSILVDARTREATQLAAHYRAVVPPQSGDFGTRPRWLLLGLSDAPGANRLRAKLIGRGEEMQFLRSLYRRAVDGRKHHLVTIIGPAGVGKTRVVEEMVNTVRSSPEAAVVLRGRCPAYGEGLTYWPLTEMLKQECDIKDNDPPAVVSEKLRTGVLRVCEPLLGRSECDIVVADFASVLGVKVAPVSSAGLVTALARAVTEDRGGAPRSGAAKDASDLVVPGSDLRRSVRAFFVAKASAHPLVLVFEDLHWAEESLLELLEYLAIRAPDAPILTLCVTRPELLERRPEWGGRVRNYVALSLSPLTEDASRHLVSDLLKGEAIPRDVLEAILGKAEGNPFFIEEILRMLIDGASLVRDDRGWHWASSSLEIRIPETIHGLVASRLDLLSPLEKRAIQVASVSGRVFWLGALLATSELNTSEASAALDRLEERELVEERATSALVGEQEFIFKHALTREVAYRTLPKSLRGESHERFAHWLERATANETDEFLEVLAHHYEQAWRYQFETGKPSAVLARKAIDVLRQAGARASSLRTLPEARKLYDRALAIFGKMALEDEPLLLELLTERAEVVKWSAATAADLALLLKDTQAVLEQAPALGREDLLARAWLSRAHAEHARTQLQPAEDALGKALDLFRKLQDRQGEAEAFEILGMITEDLRGSLRSAQGAFQKALELYRALADGRGIARTTARLGRTLLQTGPLEAARAALTEALPLAQTYHERGFEATSLVGLAIHAHLTGDFAASVRRYHEAIAIHQELGAPITEARLHRRLAMAYLRHRHLDEAEQELQRVGALLAQQGAHAEETPPVLRVLAELALARGDLYAAAEFAERAVATTAEYDTISVATHEATLARVRAAQGRGAESDTLFQRSLKELEASDYRIDLALTWLKYGDALLALDQHTRAREGLAQARTHFAEIGASFFVREVDARLETVTA